MNCGTIPSFTRATAQPPHPAPVSLAPKAPFSRHTSTSSSNSGQLVNEYGKQYNVMFIEDWKANRADLCYRKIDAIVYLHSYRTLQL